MTLRGCMHYRRLLPQRMFNMLDNEIQSELDNQGNDHDHQNETTNETQTQTDIDETDL